MGLTIFGLIGIPVAVLALTRSLWTSWWFSVVVGVGVLSARMVYLESVAPDSDFDIVFFVGMAMWALIVAVAYTGLFVAIAVPAKAYGKLRREKRHA